MSPVPSPYRQLNDPHWLRTQYLDRGRTAADTAAEVGCSRSAVAVAMDRLGVPARPTKVPQHPELSDPQWLAAQVAAGRTPRETADGLGCHRTSVSAALPGPRHRQAFGSLLGHRTYVRAMVGRVDRRHRIENLRRSVAMLSPGQTALDRDKACRLLDRLHDLEVLVDEIQRLLDDLDERYPGNSGRRRP
jgi:hypothetical protein